MRFSLAIASCILASTYAAPIADPKRTSIRARDASSDIEERAVSTPDLKITNLEIFTPGPKSSEKAYMSFYFVDTHDEGEYAHTVIEGETTLKTFCKRTIEHPRKESLHDAVEQTCENDNYSWTFDGTTLTATQHFAAESLNCPEDDEVCGAGQGSTKLALLKAKAVKGGKKQQGNKNKIAFSQLWA